MRRRSRAGPERAKSRRRKTATQKRGGLRNPSAADDKTQSDVAQLTRERDQALEREKATAEVLKVISCSPGELQPVFQSMLDNALRICDAQFGIMFEFSDGAYRSVSFRGVPQPYDEYCRDRDDGLIGEVLHQLDLLAAIRVGSRSSIKGERVPCSVCRC